LIVDGDFPWILVGAFLLWVFNLLGGKKRTRPERPQQPQPSPPARVPGRTGGQSDATQREGSQLEALLRALERRLDPSAASAPPQRQTRMPAPQTAPPPLGRPASRPLPEAEDLEDRESLEAEPVVESLEAEVRRPERGARDWLRQAEDRERARIAAVEGRDRMPHKARHEEFDRRIRPPQPAAASGPVAGRLTTAQIRQAFIWGEILGRPRGER
jgi:hypothetical protein